jgi:hypothetical protein
MPGEARGVLDAPRRFVMGLSKGPRRSLSDGCGGTRERIHTVDAAA